MMRCEGWPLDIDHVEVVGPTSLRIRFHSGEVRRVDLAPLLRGPVFERHHDPVYFARVSIHPDMRVLTWPDDTDLAPEALMDLAVEPDPECPAGFGDEEARDVRRAIADASGRYRLPGARPDQVARFSGIEVVMDGADGSTPYLTARDEAGTAHVALGTRAILAGNLWPESVETLVEWMRMREHELWANWRRVQRGEAPEWIQPIDWGAVEPE